MSGGFFRGTSADQDTRFSNKQAKLLKSQKFAPELEHLVDMTKVNMDVMRPWIAKRVTELIGIEDEVLINFIYGLLEGKEVNGKQIQISLTGFMERNTGKFMKELWSLLLSAQKNESGVPQQLLDEKMEELKKKKAETDRIANEIHRKREKEKQELDLEKNKMDSDGGTARDKHGELEFHVKHGPRGRGMQPADDKEKYNRNGLRGLGRGSPSLDSASHSPSPRRRSRSTSGDSPTRSRSVSSERQRRSSPRRSASPRQRRIIRHSPSPLKHRSSRSRLRAASRSRNGSPSPARYRVNSPGRYKSRSPLRRRSRSPIQRRSRTPVRYRSRSPLRRRSPSPVRRRSPSPVRRRSPSPVRRRSPSPVRRRPPSPVRRRSPSPVRRGSPSPVRRRPPSARRQSPSPVRRRYRRSPSTPRQQSISPVRRRFHKRGRERSFTPDLRRSHSPLDSSSLSPVHRSSPSPVRRSSPSPLRRGPLKRRSPVQSPGERIRSHEKRSPDRRAYPNESTDVRSKIPKGSTAVERRPVVSLRSPQRDIVDRNDLRGKGGVSSPYRQKSPFDSSRDRGYSEERRSQSPHAAPSNQKGKTIQSDSLPKAAGSKRHNDDSRTTAAAEDFSRRDIEENKYGSSEIVSPRHVVHKESLDSAETHSRNDASKSRKTLLMSSDKEHKRDELSTVRKPTDLDQKRRESLVGNGDKTNDKNRVLVDDGKSSCQFPKSEALPKSSRKSEHDGHNVLDSPSKESDDRRSKVKGKRKHKKSDRRESESDDYSSDDSYDERKEAKRRRKEEKKLKKEERRRRREERRRRREERRAEKLKLKSVDASSSSSDPERDHSEDDRVQGRGSRESGIQETESEQKKLEIELREKALESLRAKKGIAN